MNRARHWATLLLAAGLVLALASGLVACDDSSDSASAPAEPQPSAVPVASSSPATLVPPEETQQPLTTPPDAPIPEPATPGEPSPPAAERPAPEPAPRSFRYDTYDRSGAVAEPGHYAFLADPVDPTSVVTTYEELRDGTATALLIHTHDAHGVSQAAHYATIAPGDLFEWRQADDCFVRYTVTAVKDDPAGDPPRKLLAVAWMTYAYSGCSGALSSTATASLQWGPLPNLGGTSLTAPIRHGLWQLTPVGWTGVTEAEQGFVRDALPGTYTRDIREARRLERWREPTVPNGWTFWFAVRDLDVTPYGYEAAWGTEDGYMAFILRAEEWWYDARLVPGASSADNPAVVAEARMIAGRPAIATYSPQGPNHDPYYSILLRVYDPPTNTMYTMFNYTPRLSGSNIEAVIAIAESLFEPPNP